MHTFLRNLNFITKAVRDSLKIFSQKNEMIRADFNTNLVVIFRMAGRGEKDQK